jgi:hypothetical protein
MTKFKTGDRVRVVRQSTHEADFNVIGAVGTVAEDSEYPYVEFDNRKYGTWVVDQARLARITDEPVEAPSDVPVEGPKVYGRSTVRSMDLSPDVILDLVGDYLNATYGIAEKPVSISVRQAENRIGYLSAAPKCTVEFSK